MLVSTCLLAASLFTCEWHRPGTAPRLRPDGVKVAALGAPPLAPRLARRAARLPWPRQAGSANPVSDRVSLAEPAVERFGRTASATHAIVIYGTYADAVVESEPEKDRGKRQARRGGPQEGPQNNRKKKDSAPGRSLAYAVPDESNWLSSIFGSGKSGDGTGTDGRPMQNAGYEAVRAAARRYGPGGSKFEKLARDIAYTESRGRCNAVSSAKALGVMQTKYGTARMMGYKGSPEGLKNCRTGAEWGVKYLAYCHELAKGDVRLTSLCYNQGHGVLTRPDKYGKLSGRKEAVNYIKIMKSRGWRM